MGYRWYDAEDIQPLFVFGHGLSYTSFAYSGLTSKVNGDGSVTISFTLANTGAVAGAEVAQVYAALPSDGVEPPKRLVGWQKLPLAAGTSHAVSVTVKPERLAIWDIKAKKWRLPDGQFTFFVGSSSRDSRSLTSAQTLTGKLL